MASVSCAAVWDRESSEWEGGTEEVEGGSGTPARKEGGEGGGTGAGMDDRSRDAVREAKKGIFLGGGLRFHRADRTPPHRVFFAGQARSGSAPDAAGAGLRGLSEWGSACVD